MAAILTLAVGLFLAWFYRRQVTRIRVEMQIEAATLRSEFELLRAEGLPTPPPNGFNMNRRPDTLRRLRSGQSVDTVAAITGWAAPELVLLQKIEAIFASGR